MNDEQYFLANAYLDGELTVDERRIAEADPEVMAEVEQLRALQAELRDVPAPSGSSRESAIAAAMAEFSGSSAEAATSADDHAPPVIPFRPRPAYAKLLGIAAAVVAVAGLGIIVSQADLGGDDDDASSADVAEAPTADRSLIESNPAGDSAEDTADMAADDGGADGGEDTGVVSDEGAGNDRAEADDMTAAAGATEATAESGFELDEAESEEMADEAADGDVSVASPTLAIPRRWVVGFEFDPEAPIMDERELGVYGVYLLDERGARRLPPSPNTSCGVDDEILATATIIVDDPAIDDRAIDVYVSVIEDEGLVFARDTDTCAVVAVGSIFVS